jgi:hypothetical protein
MSCAPSWPMIPRRRATWLSLPPCDAWPADMTRPPTFPWLESWRRWARAGLGRRVPGCRGAGRARPAACWLGWQPRPPWCGWPPRSARGRSGTSNRPPDAPVRGRGRSSLQGATRRILASPGVRSPIDCDGSRPGNWRSIAGSRRLGARPVRWPSGCWPPRGRGLPPGGVPPRARSSPWSWPTPRPPARRRSPPGPPWHCVPAPGPTVGRDSTSARSPLLVPPRNPESHETYGPDPVPDPSVDRGELTQSRSHRDPWRGRTS